MLAERLTDPLAPHLVGDDVQSELLITQLLEEDLRLIHEVEKLQLEQVLEASKTMDSDDKPQIVTDNLFSSDADVAMQMFVADSRLSSDAAYAATLQQHDAGLLQSQQYAQRLEANERKIALDAEFAKKLQQMNDEGGQDVDCAQDADKVLGRDTIDRIMSLKLDGSDKGKGKMRDDSATPVKVKMEEESNTLPDNAFDTCGICFEPLQITNSPIAASQSANSSARVPFGLRLTCPGMHAYCGSCLSNYVVSKLDPEGSGEGNVEKIVFPIKCPGCPIDHWPQGIEDYIAEKVLGEKRLELWRHQKFLDSLPKIYCPNPKCSALVQADENQEQPQAQCPSCDNMMCLPCRVPWHAEYTCEQYQALPLDERLPEDRLLLALAKAKHWRRCPQCKVVIELAHGCNHISCRCGTHFCFRCGALWDTASYKCSRKPACDTWDEEMLLNEEERQRDQGFIPAVAEPAPVVAPPPVYAPPAYRAVPPPPVHLPVYRPQHHRVEVDVDLSWLENPGRVSTRHWFTKNMIRDLQCGYCNRLMRSLNGLRHHLAHIKRHTVYACCERLFRTEDDFIKHRESSGFHEYAYSNDPDWEDVL